MRAAHNRHEHRGHIEVTGDVAAPASRSGCTREIDVVTASAKRDADSVAPEVAYAHREGSQAAAPSWKPLAPGRWVVTIDYRAEIVDHDPGAYASARAGDDGRRVPRDRRRPAVRVHAVRVDVARRALPCVDEPRNKVPWQLTPTCGHMLAASNADRARDRAAGQLEARRLARRWRCRAI
jgi:hypothetical protein